MSAGKAEYRAVPLAEEIRLTELRAQQELARQERLRRQAERIAADRSLQEVMQRVERLNARVDDAVRQADAAAASLPDFDAPTACTRPELNNAPATGSEVEAIQQFVRQAHQELEVAEASIRAYEQDVRARSQHAEELLRQRERLARAWAEIRQHQTAVARLEREIRALGQADLLEGQGLTPAPDNRPAPALLPRVEAYLKLIVQHLATLQQRLSQARERAARDGQARATSRAQVAGHAAVDALNKAAVEQRTRYQEGLRQAKAQALAAAGWTELPQALQVLFDMALSDAAMRFVPAQIMDWTGIEASMKRDQERALALMADAPPLRALNAERMLAWQAHLGQLQAVAQGLQTFTPAQERTHDAIHRAAAEVIQFEYLKADFALALGGEFDVYEGDQGQIVALHDNGFWYGAWLKADGGQSTGNSPAIAVAMELFDGTGSANASQAAMDAACQAATQAAGQAAPKSTVQAESFMNDVKHIKKKVPPRRKKGMAYAL